MGKTGGTALRKSLKSAGLNCSYEFTQSKMTKDEARELDQFDIICGHIKPHGSIEVVSKPQSNRHLEALYREVFLVASLCP